MKPDIDPPFGAAPTSCSDNAGSALKLILPAGPGGGLACRPGSPTRLGRERVPGLEVVEVLPVAHNLGGHKQAGVGTSTRKASRIAEASGLAGLGASTRHLASGYVLRDAVAE